MSENLFKDLGVSEELLTALEKKGFVNPTPIQQQTIPLLLNDTRDIIGQAQTGTGKTAAFGIPILQKIEQGKRKVQALILTPTRELAVQVTEEIVSFKGKSNIYILPVYGGQGMDYQLRRLREGVDIVVGTPGRVIDHIEKGTLNLSDVKFFVLDEADEMLNMGFLEEVEKILQHIPKERSMLLFSATMPDRIRQIAEKYMGKYNFVRIEKNTETSPQIEQVYYEVYPEDKLNMLCRIVDTAKDIYALVFCKTRMGTDDIAHQLIERGYAVEALHGDISQQQREIIMRKFKNKRSNILIATDVAARGIDVNDLTHVINYDIPGDGETYTHRIGRTGRAGKKGLAITILTPTELRKLNYMLQGTKFNINKGKIPSVAEIIEKKKQAILEEITLMVSKEDYEDMNEIAENLVAFNEPAFVISALVKKLYGKHLNPSRYTEIKVPMMKEKRKPDDRFKNDRDRDRGGYRNDDRGGRDRDRGGRERERSGSRERVGGGLIKPTTGIRKDSFHDAPGKDRFPARKKSHEVLFFGKGSKDGITSKIFTEYIKDETGVPNHKIYEVDVFPRFTLFKVNQEEAGKILEKFKNSGGEKPLVKRDKNSN